MRKRDPRGHIVSVAYATQLQGDTLPRAGSDAISAEWADLRQITLGFDRAPYSGRREGESREKAWRQLGKGFSGGLWLEARYRAPFFHEGLFACL